MTVGVNGASQRCNSADAPRRRARDCLRLMLESYQCSTVVGVSATPGSLWVARSVAQQRGLASWCTSQLILLKSEVPSLTSHSGSHTPCSAKWVGRRLTRQRTSAASGGPPDLTSLLESIGLERSRAPHSNAVGADCAGLSALSANSASPTTIRPVLRVDRVAAISAEFSQE